MGFVDRVRAWLKGEGKKAAPSKSVAPANKEAVREIEAFVKSRTGVEAFLEPKTTIYSMTLLLVAADGEYLRRPIKDRPHAKQLSDKLGMPLYDAAKVGYPRRMRDYDRGIKRSTVSLDELPPWPGDDAEPQRPNDER